MQSRLPAFSRRVAIALVAFLLSAVPALAQQGFILSGVGPVNRAMAGASTAAPLDASGALHWNPAAISGLGHSDMDFGVELLYPQAKLSSSLPAGPPGSGLPPIPLYGIDRSNGGAAPLPTAGFVYQPEQSPWTMGLGIFEVGGFFVNYPASLTNPVLISPARGGILGPVSSELQVFQLAPTIAYKLTDHLSFGFAPTADLAYLTVDPGFIAPPDPVTGLYTPATHTRIHWGLGCQAGVYYTTDVGLNFGASLKSPQWFEPFTYNTQTSTGLPRTTKFHFDYPMIASLGTAYTGIEHLVLAVDFRYIDFKNTEGFRKSGFDEFGALRGLGWENLFEVAVGARYCLTDRLAVMAGYTFNTNPIDDDKTFFNVASPTIAEHTVSAGASYQVTQSLSFSMAYVHAFENSISGPIILPGVGTVPGSAVKSELRGDAILFGAEVKF